jgi:hypothetical protein
MDGRVQLPVIEYLQERFQAAYVDSVTAPAPNHILASQSESSEFTAIMAKIRISVNKHSSVGIAVVGHFDCAGFPAPRETQRQETLAAIELIREEFPGIPVLGLWVDSGSRVSEIEQPS